MFWQVTVDASDPERLTRFWAAAMGWTGTPPEGEEPWQRYFRQRLGDQAAYTDRLFDPSGAPPTLWFQQVPEPKAGKNRLHLDLYPTGRDAGLTREQRTALVDAEVARLVGLGASVLHVVADGDLRDVDYFTVMRDPEGNEFCVS